MRGLHRTRSVQTIATGHAFVRNLRRAHYQQAIDHAANDRVRGGHRAWTGRPQRHTKRSSRTNLVGKRTTGQAPRRCANADRIGTDRAGPCRHKQVRPRPSWRTRLAHLMQADSESANRSARHSSSSVASVAGWTRSTRPAQPSIAGAVSADRSQPGSTLETRAVTRHSQGCAPVGATRQHHERRGSPGLPGDRFRLVGIGESGSPGKQPGLWPGVERDHQPAAVRCEGQSGRCSRGHLDAGHDLESSGVEVQNASPTWRAVSRLGPAGRDAQRCAPATSSAVAWAAWARAAVVDRGDQRPGPGRSRQRVLGALGARAGPVNPRRGGCAAGSGRSPAASPRRWAGVGGAVPGYQVGDPRMWP
jgi:hypothetical protein